MSQLILIRADASTGIGSGHVMRCLALADELQRAGAEVEFACRGHAGHLMDVIRDRGFEVHRLSASGASAHVDAGEPAWAREYAHWLGVPQEEDAAETLAAVGNRRVDCVIVDHYGIDAAWEALVRPHVGFLVAIDDLANRAHEADVLLDQNYFADGETRYDGLVPSDCVRLLGPRFALLRREFAQLNARDDARRSKVERVFVFFGGQDVGNVTGRVVDALCAPEFAHLEVDVVVGSGSPHCEDIACKVARRPKTALHVQVGNVAELMARADLAIGAGGVATWERLCLGLYCVVATVAANQVPFIRDLAAKGCLDWLGDAATVDVRAWRMALGSALAAWPQRMLSALRWKDIVRGDGSRLVTRQILQHPSTTSSAGKAKLRLSVLSDRGSWMTPYLGDLLAEWSARGHTVALVEEPADVPTGDICFFLGSSKLVPGEILQRNRNNIVAHASALPLGKGWSPWVWQILEGKKCIPLSIFEAAISVDSGAIYLQRQLELKGHELLGEIRDGLAALICESCLQLVCEYPRVLNRAVRQEGASTYYARRGPADSRLDPNRTIAEQFNLLRVVDNDRFPAFFDWLDHRYVIRIDKGQAVPSLGASNKEP